MEKNLVMNNDELSLEANLDIIICLVTEFSNSVDSYEFEDLLQVAYLGALKAIKNYDEEVGPLKPYVFSCVRNHLLRFLKSEKRWSESVELISNISPKYNDDHTFMEFKNVIDNTKKLLPLERNLLHMKVLGLSRKEICDNLSLTKNEYYNFMYSGLNKI
jgi:RNA polymerase sigma factor (sigma-70 family)|tara:strand:- start:3460 stop:3939 length:480 start_codon:yes stop_codon:yes gene_type:complete